jgi:outer membrane protein OmpA-like peptidoglycan-associated protein
MKKPPILIMILMMMAIQSALAQQGENLVRNGTFEQGNVGFKSDFRFFSNEAFGRLLITGSYCITNYFPDQDYRFHHHISQTCYDSLAKYDGLANCDTCAKYDSLAKYNYNPLGDRQSFGRSSDCIHIQTAVNPKGQSTGNFLTVNVNESVNQRLWYDSITIKPNTNYSFSCLVANVWHNTYINMKDKIPELCTCWEREMSSHMLPKLCVNGKIVSKRLNRQSSKKWRILNGNFTSGPDQTRIEISIQDWQFPNLVALDDIVFKEIQPGEYEKGFAKREQRFSVLEDKDSVVAYKKENVMKAPPVKKEESVIVILPVKKDTASQIADFKKDISINEIKIDQKWQLSHIYFESGKYNLLAASFPELNDLAAFMKKYTTVRIRLEGHTDNQGGSQLNLELSENRAKEVKKYLVDQGIDENRIEWIGYGGQRPTNNNSTEYLRQKNRRVEVVITGK